MTMILENEYLSVKINPVGAELCSIYGKEEKCEYLWQADPKVWERHAPILFPAVGRVAGDSYIYGGKRYRMGKHGFARDMKFEEVAKSRTSLVLRLRSDNATKEIFPFDFEFDVYFSLCGKTLTEKYTVRNLGAEKMYFSIGAHPGFFCKHGDFIRFEKPETLKAQYLDGSDTVGNPDDFIMLDGKDKITLTKELFERGSLALEAPRSTYAELCTPCGKPYLRESYGNIPMLWLWAKAGEEYICIEPWHGSDERHVEEVLEKKKGIVELDYAKTFEFPIEITIM